MCKNCKNQPSPENVDNNDREDARVGYQAAINLWTYQGEEIWARFNVMIVANSILIGVIGLVITNPSKISIISIFFSVILSLSGILICLAWFLIMMRSNDYQFYYVQSARELEKHLSNTVNTVSKGNTFSKGETVYRNSEPIKMDKLSCLFSSQNISYIIIILFVFIYIISFILLKIYIISLILSKIYIIS